MSMAAAAITLTACSDVEEFSPNNELKNTLTVIAGNPEVEGDTRTQLDVNNDGKIIPLWSSGDYIYMVDWNITTDKLQCYTQFFESNKLSEFGDIAKFNFTNLTDVNANDSISFVYAKNTKTNVNGNKYIGEYGRTSRMKSLNAVIPTEMTPTYWLDFSDGDILISEDNMTYPADGTLNVKFKRYTSVVKMIINKATIDLIETNDYIASVELSGYNFDLAGDVDYGLKDKLFTCYDNRKLLKINLSKVNASFNEKDGFVFSCAPVDKEEVEYLAINQQDNITFTVTTKSGRKFVKTVNKLFEKGFELHPGTRNTISLTLSKENEVEEKPVDPNALIYEPGSGVVKVQKPGTLTKDHVIKIIGSTNSIKVIGKMSDSDMNALRDYLWENPNPCKVDLSEADLMNGGQINTEIGEGFITAEHKISELILPNSLTTINGWAVRMGIIGATLVVGPNVTTIVSGALGHSTQVKSNKFNTIIKAPYIKGKTNYAEQCIRCTIGGSLKLHYSWRDSGEGFYKTGNDIRWKGSEIAWGEDGKKHAYYIEEDGTETLVNINDLPAK